MRRCSFLLVVVAAACGNPGSKEVDAGSTQLDAGGAADAGTTKSDAGRGFSDAAVVIDAGLGSDAAPIDAAPIDAAAIDAAAIDAAAIDAAAIDAAAIDAAPIDAAPIDANSNTVMTFFVTSTGSGSNGGNLGGLSGADAKCQDLATNVGAGSRTWRAYLSNDTPAVNARDRIGTGPWSNHAGVLVAANLTDLHTNVPGSLILTELGEVVPSDPLDHDILTGSDSNGNLQAGETCSNWTDSTDNSGGQVGHADIGVADLGSESWNSQHDPQCSQAALLSTAGTGRTYCFAID